MLKEILKGAFGPFIDIWKDTYLFFIGILLGVGLVLLVQFIVN